MTDRLPPHSIEAEQGILGSILLAPRDCLDQCAVSGVEPAWFYDLRHQTIFSVLSEMHQANDWIDTLTVTQRLRDRNVIDEVGGMVYLSTLVDSVPSPHNLPSYVATARQKHVLRRMLQVCSTAIGRVHEPTSDADGLLEEVERDIQRVSESRFDGGKSKTLEPKQCARTFSDDLERRFNLKGALSGIATGFADLDKMTSGLQAGELVIIGARPSAGKTAMAASIISHACLVNGIPSVFITLEMRESAILRRIASARLTIPIATLRDGDFSENDFKKLMTFNAWIARSKLFFIDGVSGITIAQIASELRALIRKHAIKLVVVDYLQKIKPAASKEKRTYEVGAVSEALKGLAANLGVSIVALAQLNREPDKDKGRQPRASDLADSAQIERDADLIALIHRPRTEEDPKGESAKLIIAKQRDGEVGVIHMNFSAAFCQFTNQQKV